MRRKQSRGLTIYSFPNKLNKANILAKESIENLLERLSLACLLFGKDFHKGNSSLTVGEFPFFFSIRLEKGFFNV